MVVVGIVFEKIWNINVNCVNVTGARNIGQGHRVNVPAKSGGQGDVSCKGMMVVVELWLIRILTLT